MTAASPEVPEDLPEVIAGVLLMAARAYASVWPKQSPFRDRLAASRAPVVSPGCYRASFGMVHVRPACRCSR